MKLKDIINMPDRIVETVIHESRPFNWHKNSYKSKSIWNISEKALLMESWVTKLVTEICNYIKNHPTNTLSDFIKFVQNKNISVIFYPHDEFDGEIYHSNDSENFIINIGTPVSLNFDSLIKNTPKQVFNILIHELRHAIQPKFMKRNYINPSDITKQDFLNNFKLLSYLVQPAERETIAIDIIFDLLLEQKTFNDLTSCINYNINSFKSLNSTNYKVTIYNNVKSFCSNKFLFQFLFQYLMLKYNIIQAPTDELNKLEKQSKMLIKQIQKNYNIIKAYNNI